MNSAESLRNETDVSALDQAARAGWLYYVAGMTQDQIAVELGISRQRAQRLVSRAVAENLIHVRLEHPVARCLELESALARRYGLTVARVAPALGPASDPARAIAPVAATEMERFLSRPEPLVIALGTGRTLRAAVDELTKMECEQHKIVSLNGNIAPDGSASYYDVIMRIAERVRAPHYPMPLPVIAETPEERAMFYSLRAIRSVARLARGADVTFIGIGQMTDTAPLLKDRFITDAELGELRTLGAVGEIAGWVYDEAGIYLTGGTNQRVGGVQVAVAGDRAVIGIAGGAEKVPAIRGALIGRLVNGLITTEDTAEALLE